MDARFRLKAHLILLLPALAAGPSRADDSAMYDIGGGTVAPMAQHPSVRMVNETVSVRLTGKGARVRCTFTFRNEGKARMVKMGFPEVSRAAGDVEAGGILSGFRSRVDGTSIRCVYKRGRFGDENQSLRSWYVKDVPFGAGQTRVVTDEYNTRLGYASSDDRADYETAQTFLYILQTGRNWKGPIAKARIIVDVTGIPAEREASASPDGYVQTGRSLSWTFTDFEPKEDISVALLARYPSLNGVEDPKIWSPFSRSGGVSLANPAFLERLGARIQWPESGPFLIRHNGHTLQMAVASKAATLDGKTITLQAPPIDKYGVPQIPLASVVRALGGKAHFDPEERRLVLWLKPAPKPAKPRRN